MGKRLFLILAACLAALAGHQLNAGPVSPGRALEIGKRLLEGPSTRGGEARVSIIWDGETTPSAQTPAFYVIGRDGGGFVILSADDNARPVLGISEHGRFETKDMPENVRWWMERMKAYVRKQVVPDEKAASQWASLSPTRADGHITGTVTVRKEFQTPEWNQGNTDSYYFGQQVFNKYCPQSSGGLTVTGCVATAMAELLTTLSGLYPDDMPAKGQGTVGGYSAGSNYVAPPAYELTTTYDWAGLRTLTGTAAIRKAIEEGKTALLDNLGHLLADCGAIAQAVYSVNGTSAGSGSNVVRGFAEHLYTSKTAHTESESLYTPTQWKRMLKEELEKHPLLYSGQSPSMGGHAFLFDGYGLFEGDDVFHVNFGWSGACNGYYFYDNLDTGDGFIYSDHGMTAIFDFYPDARQSTTYPKKIKYIPFTLSDGSAYNGITAQGDVLPDQSVVIQVGGVQNAGSEDFTGEFRIWREDKDGNKIGDSLYARSYQNNPLRPNYYSYAWFSRWFSDISWGDKLVGYYSTDSDNTVWERIIAPTDGTIVEEMPLVPAAFIRTESSYAVGDSFLLRIMNYSQPYAGTVWTITTPDGGTVTLRQAEGEFTLTQPGKYKIVAAIAPKNDEAVVEKVVTYITVR